MPKVISGMVSDSRNDGIEDFDFVESESGHRAMRTRKMTEKGVRYWVEEREKDMRNALREIDAGQKRIMERISDGDTVKLRFELGRLSDNADEYFELCSRLIGCDDDDVDKEKIELTRREVMTSVQEAIRLGEKSVVRSHNQEKSSRKSSSRKPSSCVSRSQSGRSGLSSLGILKMKMIEAEIELEDSKLELECEKNLSEEVRLQKKLELEREEKERALRSRMAVKKAEKRVEIMRRHIEEQELGSDEPSDDDEPEKVKTGDCKVKFEVSNEKTEDCNVKAEDCKVKAEDCVAKAEGWKVKAEDWEVKAEDWKVDKVDPRDCIIQEFMVELAEQNAPGVRMDKFSGDPLDFRKFITSFEETVERRVTTNTGRYSRLLQYCEECEEAAQLIAPHQFDRREGYARAKRALQKRYASEHTISAAYHREILHYDDVKEGVSIRKFFLFLTKVKYAQDSSDFKVELNSHNNLKTLAEKLPRYLQDGWNRRATELYEYQEKKPTFENFLNFLEKESLIATNASFSRSAMETEKRKDDVPRKRIGFNAREGEIRMRTCATKGDVRQGSGGRGHGCEFCGMDNHKLNWCYKFRKLTIEERNRHIDQARLCFGCLQRGHIARNCTERLTCTICNGKHPTSLHREDAPSHDGNNTAGRNREVADATNTSKQKTAVTELSAVDSSLACVLVEIPSPRGPIRSYCFLDSLSTGSYITKDLVSSLSHGVQKETEYVTISTLSGVCTERKISLSNVGLKGAHGSLKVKKLYEIDGELPVGRREVMFNEEARRWPHLSCIVNQIPDYDPNVPFGLLLGNDVPRALEPHDVIRGSGDSPYAVKYLFGWNVAGPKTSSTRSSTRNGHHESMATSLGRSAYCVQGGNEVKEDSERDIREMFRSMYEKEFLDPRPNDRMSQQDADFVENLIRSTEFVDGKYQIPLQLDDGKAILNKDVVRRDAIRFRDRLNRTNSGERTKIIAFMNDMEEKGYSERVPVDKEDEGRFYIPYHSVKNEKKPDKTRVVFNGAKRSGGYPSLNDLLISGPDLCNSLVGVLCRWRQEDEAFVADIKYMFYQTKVPPDQRAFLRYFWWDDDKLEGLPTERQMTVHLFGASSSPATANFALKKCAEDFGKDFPPETRSTIQRDIYVDDLCKSVPDVETGEVLARDVRELCARAGYRLTKFAATNPAILNQIPDSDKLPDTCVDMDGQPRVDRVLGIQWTIRNDSLKFQVVLKNRPATRRGLLSSLHGVYDPLGLASPFMLEGRRLLQSLSKTDWDETVDQSTITRWRDWVTGLSQVEKLDIRRCYKPKDFGPVVRSELHVYSDGSEIGYGCCVYTRLENAAGRTAVALVEGKSRVVPLVGETIARIELVAAALAAERGARIAEELTYTDMPVYHWTDSEIVLAYLKNETKRFKTFVSNRVRRIRQMTKIENWSHVKSEENAADDASRGLTAVDVDEEHRWFAGPRYLQLPRADWDNGPVDLPDLTGCKELKVEKVACTSNRADDGRMEDTYWLKIIETLSDWPRMAKRVAVIKKTMSELHEKGKGNVSNLQTTVADLRLSEMEIIKAVQRREFASEIKRLVAGDEVKADSAIVRLDPYLDSDGLLRVNGRLQNSSFDTALKNPVILPKIGPVTDAIIRFCHSAVSHCGRNATMNEIRGRGYWIINLNARVRQAIHNCVHCRKCRGKGGEQKMASLPDTRLEEAPPFSYCGVDMFGPFVTKQGRKEVKRYVALFTDLVYRGIHLEMCHSMDADSFTNAIRRFVARRGNIRYLRSDNGTNFTGARTEIQKAMSGMEGELRKYLLSIGCDFAWRFNTPYASHHGGIWERQIGSARRILESTLRSHPGQLSDESMVTLLAEIEGVVNSRPLSVETLNDPNSDLPLSPMCILTGKTKVVLPPFGEFDKSDLYSKQWRRVQHLANEFWSRFRKEFLTNLNARPKWTKERRNYQIGDVVLLRDDSLHRNDWPMGIITYTHADESGHVRSARIRTSRGDLKADIRSYDRPITKLVLLLEASRP